MWTNRNVFVIYDINVKDQALRFADEDNSFALKADETHKTFDTVGSICRWLLEKGADRKATLIAVGGGVTSDITGFVASIYKRGIRYINVPTTLLAMVDASIGGKTGVNLDGYKNMLGTFKEPECTYICTEFLKTLPEKELKSGIAEMLKTFLIKDKRNYEKAFCLLRAPYELSELAPFIKAAAKIKRSIVLIDPFERDRRRLLNLGHTYGHAIEWWQSQGGSSNYSHGQAVAIGIIKAAQLSEARGYSREGLAKTLKNDFESCGLPTELPCPEKELDMAIKNDKKSEDGKVRFVFLKEIGKARIGTL